MPHLEMLGHSWTKEKTDSNVHVNRKILFLCHEFDERIIPLKLTYFVFSKVNRVLINLTL